MLTQRTGIFGLKYAIADNISNVIDAFNMLREAENKLKRFGLSFESVVTLVKDLESEQNSSDLSNKAFLTNLLQDTKTVLKAILGVEAINTKTMYWDSIGPKYQAYANTIR
ncbi:14248_t:CDS:2, partial [Funneliformis geosporum]